MTAPPLDEELERLLRRMRLPHIRRAAPEVLATAKAQRWDPVEVLKALLTEEVTGRDRSALATRRAALVACAARRSGGCDCSLSALGEAPTSRR